MAGHLNPINMLIPKLAEYLAPAGSHKIIDYMIPKIKEMKSKLEIVSQFVDACIANKERLELNFPNSKNSGLNLKDSDSYPYPFLIAVTGDGVTTNLNIPVDSQEQMDALQERANSRFKKASN
ncbi:hypothetical protein JAO73_13390 [Hymenobacter sp. BT523]|uniref:hypothetical protein n=1 Tax=Hymenobacter sp. BT523 TaxID=2795725 RepID=UPI0018EA9374|nr:hypothetical protein [Hymenobacter sp. BT523]MBJ6110010.1 hypothetical protein [Hymenobacter sp. BT523]